jgi:hypothetical protein
VIDHEVFPRLVAVHSANPAASDWMRTPPTEATVPFPASPDSSSRETEPPGRKVGG